MALALISVALKRVELGLAERRYVARVEARLALEVERAEGKIVSFDLAVYEAVFVVNLLHFVLG